MSQPALSSPQPSPVPAPPKPRVWTVFAVLVATYAVSIFATSIVVFAMLLDTLFVSIATAADGRPDPAAFEAAIEGVQSRPELLVISTFLMSLFSVGGAGLAARLSAVAFVRRLSLGPTPWTGGRLALGYAAAMLGTVALGALWDVAAHVAFGGLSPALERFDEQIRAAPLAWYLPLALGIAVVGPIGEEVIFRGFAQTRLVERLGRWGGIVLTSVLFGVVHGDPMHISFAFLMGLFLGWVAARTGSIRPAIAAHVFNNTMAVLAPRLDVPDPEGVALAAFVVGSTAALVGACVAIGRLTPATDGAPAGAGPA